MWLGAWVYVCANATTLQIPCTCYLVIKRILSYLILLLSTPGGTYDLALQRVNIDNACNTILLSTPGGTYDLALQRVNIASSIIDLAVDNQCLEDLMWHIMCVSVTDHACQCAKSCVSVWYIMCVSVISDRFCVSLTEHAPHYKFATFILHRQNYEWKKLLLHSITFGNAMIVFFLHMIMYAYCEYGI